MTSWFDLERLDLAEQRTRGRVERLRRELGQAEDLLEQLAVTRKTLQYLTSASGLGREEEVVGGGSADEPAEAGPVGEDGPPVLAAGLGSAVGSGSGPASAIRARSWERLTEANRRVVQLLATAERAMRAREIAVALGQPDEHRRVETMRTRLKRLVKAGWLSEEHQGLFSIATTVDCASIVQRAGVESESSVVNGYAREPARKEAAGVAE